MGKYHEYIEKFRKKNKINRRYTLLFKDLETFMMEFTLADMDRRFNLISTLFNLGYAKGYRAAQAEMKKGGAA